MMLILPQDFSIERAHYAFSLRKIQPDTRNGPLLSLVPVLQARLPSLHAKINVRARYVQADILFCTWKTNPQLLPRDNCVCLPFKLFAHLFAP